MTENNKIIYTTLAENPNLKKDVQKLIEDCLEYSKENDFSVDYPILNSDNLKNCHVLLDEKSQKPIAHIGTNLRYLSIDDIQFPILLIGGVCVDKNYRGQGLTKTLLDKIFKANHNKVCLYMLWGNKAELYQKFGFHLALEQQQHIKEDGAHTGAFQKIKLKELSDKDFQSIRSLYNHHLKSKFNSIERDEKDWNDLKAIESADLYIHKNDSQTIDSYFFMNKGQDLQGIIHELVINDNPELVKKACHYGHIWYPKNLEAIEVESLQYGAMVKPGDEVNFKKLISAISQNNVEFDKFDEDKAFFNFGDERYSMLIPDFITGIFGPYRLEEFQPFIKPIYISGLDSI